MLALAAIQTVGLKGLIWHCRLITLSVKGCVVLRVNHVQFVAEYVYLCG